MYEQLTARQLVEWEAYNKIDPIGTEREDFRMAFLAMIITNVAIGALGSKNAKTAKLEDFMPDWDTTKPKPVQSAEQMKNILMGLTKK